MNTQCAKPTAEWGATDGTVYRLYLPQEHTPGLANDARAARGHPQFQSLPGNPVRGGQFTQISTVGSIDHLFRPPGLAATTWHLELCAFMTSPSTMLSKTGASSYGREAGDATQEETLYTQKST